MEPASLNALQERLRQAWAEASGIGARRPGAGRVADGFARAGDRLACGSADPLDLARADLARRFGSIDVPWVAEPDITVTFHARADVASTIGVVRGLARAARVEVMLLDDGRDPRTALLRGLAANLVVVAPGREGVVRAAGMARGGLLALLDDAIESPSATALEALSAHSGAVVIGPAIMELANGVHASTRIRAAGRLGLRLCVGTADFARIGGDDWSDAGVLAFCLRAHDEGLPLMFHDEPEIGPAAWA